MATPDFICGPPIALSQRELAEHRHRISGRITKTAILLRTFTNTTLGQAFEERGTGLPWEQLAARARQSDYERGLVPKGCLLTFIGLDCQLGHVEWVLLGFGPEYRKFVVDYGTIGKPIGEADVNVHSISCWRAPGRTPTVGRSAFRWRQSMPGLKPIPCWNTVAAMVRRG